MGYLFDLSPIAIDGYPNPFDANSHVQVEGTLVNITEPSKRIWQLADRRNIPGQIVGCG